MPSGGKALILPEPFVSHAKSRQLPAFVWAE